MKNNHSGTIEGMQDDRPSTVTFDSFNTHTKHVKDSYNDHSKNTDNRHFGDRIGTINNQPSFLTARGLDILQENAVPGAAYDSSECQSTPVCPRTRTVVLDRVEKWADARDDSAICWMHGPAGIGKTSIATSIAMKYAEEKRLVGSFFFSRDPACDAGRRSVNKIFATIAYQISTSHPTVKKKLRNAIEKDPLILNNSLEHQFSHLIIAPFQPFRFGPRFLVTLRIFFEVLTSFLACIMFHSGLDDLMRSLFVIAMAVLSSIINLPTVQHALREHIKTFNHRLPMIVVIDALDECNENVVALITVLAHVYRDSPPPIRFFLTSRPEDHIRGKFRIPSYSKRTHFIDLMDFQARDDIRIFLQDGFSSLYTELEDYMRGVGTPWPSEDDLETLVEKSEGLFIYASTLLKFVGDVEDQCHGLSKERLKKSLPQERLKKAIERHDGLDGLYRQVLGDAPFRSDPNFDVLLGAMCFLYDPLGMDVLTDLLQFNGTGETRLLLRGCRSILRIPESDTDEISFFHASLRDFLTNESRSQEEYFLDPVIQHIRLLDHCIRAITTGEVAPNQDIKPTILYAWKNWHRHLHAAFQSSDAVHRLKSHFGERFETDLLEFLNSIISESSNLGDTWELVLQKQRISWMDIAPVLEDMVQDTSPLFPISKIQKVVKFLGRNSTLHWRTARAIFDEISDSLNLTLVGVDETHLDLKQTLTHLAAKLPSPQIEVLKYLPFHTGVDKKFKISVNGLDSITHFTCHRDVRELTCSDYLVHSMFDPQQSYNIKQIITTKGLACKSTSYQLSIKLFGQVLPLCAQQTSKSFNIAFTLTTNKRSGNIIWKILPLERLVAILPQEIWSCRSSFCDFERAPDGSRISVAESLFGGLDESKRDIFIYGAPVMLQAYVVPDKPGYEERQMINVDGLYALLRSGGIDISKPAERGTTFCLYSNNTGKCA